MRSAYRKIRGGKSIRVELEVEECCIREIIISGDFFAYPETVIEELEEALRGKSISDVGKIIDSFRRRSQLVGVDWGDILDIILSLYPECLDMIKDK